MALVQDPDFNIMQQSHGLFVTDKLLVILTSFHETIITLAHRRGNISSNLRPMVHGTPVVFVFILLVIISQQLR